MRANKQQPQPLQLFWHISRGTRLRAVINYADECDNCDAQHIEAVVELMLTPFILRTVEWSNARKTTYVRVAVSFVNRYYAVLWGERLR